MNIQINPQLLDLTMRDDDYAIFSGTSVLKTPDGNDFCHLNPRLLNHIIFEITLDKYISDEKISAFSIFSTQMDIIENSNFDDCLFTESLIKNDYFIRMKIMGIKTRTPDITEKLLDFYDSNRFVLNLSLGATADLQNLINIFLIEEGFENLDAVKTSPEKLFNFLMNEYRSMNNEKKAAFYLLNKIHGSGFILPMLLVSGAISPSEYAVTFFNINLNDNIISNIPPENIFSVTRDEADRVRDFLFYSNFIEQTGSRVFNLIKSGENSSIEFKSTLRWNLKTFKKDSAIEHASLKTIAAFLNSGGGHLLIGVNDDGNIVGIESDKFENDDKFLLHLWQIIADSLGEDVSSYIKTVIEKINGKSVCVVQCFRSQNPVFLKQKGFDEEFYIRLGPRSTKLSLSDAMKFMADRFNIK